MHDGLLLANDLVMGFCFEPVAGYDGSPNAHQFSKENQKELSYPHKTPTICFNVLPVLDFQPYRSDATFPVSDWMPDEVLRLH